MRTANLFSSQGLSSRIDHLRLDVWLIIVIDLFNNSKIHMDEEALAINARAEQNSATETPTVEPKAPEVVEETAKPEHTVQAAETGDAEGEKKVTGAEKRIHKLVDERDQYKQEAQSLSQKLAELTAGAQAPAGISPQYQPAQGESSGGERELTVDDLRTIARLEVEKERTIGRINSEAKEAQSKHPELDPSSDLFDPDINEAVTTAVELEIRANPTKSVKELTERYMRPYRKAAEKAVGEQQKTIAKQASEAALRPSNVKPTVKTLDDKSIEELEAELGFIH